MNNIYRSTAEEPQVEKIFKKNPRAIKYKMMEKALEGYLKAKSFPSIDPSKQRQNYSMGLFSEFGTSRSALRMWDSFNYFLQDLPNQKPFHAYFAIFDEIEISSEHQFATLMQKQLQEPLNEHIEKIDPEERELYAPNDADYSLTINGAKFYIFGMHPKSSRKTRQFPWPVLLFYHVPEPVQQP